jgi:P27 family predicted phage terminase small subunit
MVGNRRGPTPESAAVKLQKGNPGKRKIKTADDELHFDAVEKEIDPSGDDMLAVPDFVSGAGVAIWNEIAVKLKLLNITRMTDRMALARYCQNFGRWIEAQKLLSTGLTYEVKSQHGTYNRPNPAFLIVSRLERELQAQEVKFALNPADRQRLFAMRSQVGAGAGELFNNPSIKNKVPDSNKKSAIGLLN